MSRPLVIFGAGEYADVACSYFRESATHRVSAFTVDKQHIGADNFSGLPLVPFEDVARLYPPDSHDFFVAIGYARHNEIRRLKYETAKAMGYSMASYVSPHAIIHSNAQIGEHCFILETSVVEPFVRIGDNVTIWSGSIIGHYSTIASHCFLALRASIGGGTHIGEQCSLGIGATVRDHINIGPRCTIGAGALSLSDMGADVTIYGIASAKLL